MRTSARTLGAACNVVNDRAPVGSTPYVEIGDINLETKDYAYSVKASVAGAILARPGDIVISRVRPGRGAIAAVRDDVVAVSAGFTVLRPKGSAESPFLFYALAWNKQFLRFLEARSTGAVYPTVSERDVLAFPIAVPHASKQTRVVEILEEAQALRRLRKSGQQRVDALARALFVQRFGNPGTNPKRWPVQSVGTLLQAEGGIKCGPFGSALRKEEYTDRGIPVWGIPNVNPNKFVEQNSLFISESKFSELRAYEVRPGDILISRAGTVGRMCVARPEAQRSIIGTNLIRVRLDAERVIPEFVASLLTFHSEELAQLRADASEAAYSFMNTGVLKTLRIYLPPIDEQRRFARDAGAIAQLMEAQAASRRNIEMAFDAMVQRASRTEA